MRPRRELRDLISGSEIKEISKRGGLLDGKHCYACGILVDVEVAVSGHLTGFSAA
jgi:hypothetical protein